MVVCKFFLEGRCRFGDNCYNEHIAGAAERPRYQQQDQQQHYWYRQQQDRQRYESPTRYSVNHNLQKHQSPFRAQQDRYQYSSSRFDNLPSRNGGAGDNENFDYSSEHHDYDNFSAPNPYSWKSTDYGSQRGGSYNHSRYDGYQADNENDRHRSYGQNKSQSSHQSRNRYDVLRSSENKMEPASDSQWLETVKEDITACDQGKQWPFSCYFPFRGHPGFPEFSDISFEELRNEAYEAEKNNNFSDYVRSYTEALVDVQQKRDFLKKANQDVKNAVNKILSEELNLEIDPVKKQLFFSNANDSDPLTNDGTPSFFTSPLQKSQNVFSLSHLSSGSSPRVQSIFNLSNQNNSNSSEMLSGGSNTAFQQSAGKFFSNNDASPRFATTASDFVQKVPAANSSESEFYTALEDLTIEELEAFSAQTFTAGKIPVRPPPKSLCLE